LKRRIDSILAAATLSYATLFFADARRWKMLAGSVFVAFAAGPSPASRATETKIAGDSDHEIRSPLVTRNNLLRRTWEIGLYGMSAVYLGSLGTPSVGGCFKFS
jgi:hypothetical protein